jgi:biopolymer transport protein ExbD
MMHSGEGSGLDFEINLAPIIDCLTVLITFTLVSASFLSVSLLDAGVAAPQAQSDSANPPKVSLVLELMPTGEIEVRSTGQESRTQKIPAKDATWDQAALASHLQAFKKRWPDIHQVTVTADKKVEYVNIVRIMESARMSFPAVLLGEF